MRPERGPEALRCCYTMAEEAEWRFQYREKEEDSAERRIVRSRVSGRMAVGVYGVRALGDRRHVRRVRGGGRRRCEMLGGCGL